MNDSESKAFLCLIALCLAPTNRNAKLLRALGSIFKVPDKSQAGALTMIPQNVANNLERAEQLAADLRTSVTPQAALEGFAILLLLFLQGVPSSSSTTAFKNITKKPSNTVNTDFTMIQFDARTSVILRRLAYLLRIKLSTVSALEELAIFNLEQANKRLLQQSANTNSKEKKWVRGLKIGAAATAAGGLLAVTGGLAAPALAAGLAGVGLGAVATVTTTATVAALLGAGGAGLGAYKMNRRTQGVRHFEFQSINDESTVPNESPEEKLQGMTVYICVSGYLRAPGPDDGIPDTVGPETAEALRDYQTSRRSFRNSFTSSLQRATSKSNSSSSSILSSSSSLQKSNSDLSASQRRKNGKSAAHSPDFFAPWGAQPKYLFPEQILDRFYSVVAPEKRTLVPLLLQTYAGQEEELMDELERRYGLHPKQLCPPEARRDYFQAPEQQIYRDLLQRAGARLEAILGATVAATTTAATTKGSKPTKTTDTIPAWQVSESSLKTLMNTDRAWDSFREMDDSNDDDDNGENKPEEKTKEEVDEIIADLMQKFDTNDSSNQNQQQQQQLQQLPSLDSDDLAELELEKRKIRLIPSIGDGYLDRSKKPVSTELGHEVYWWRDKVARYGDQYTLVWEPESLLQVGECVQNLIKESAAKGALASLQFTVLSAFMAAVALPVAITGVVANLDNYWSMVIEAADEAGKLLADALMSDAHGNRPVVLIGYSVGGRVVASCLSALAKIAAGGRDVDDIINVEEYDGAAAEHTNPVKSGTNNNNNQRINQQERKRRLRAATIVRDAVIIGAPLDTNTKKWTQRRSVVVGRLINVYSHNDWVLALLYRYKSWSVSLAGLQKVESRPSPLFSPIENYNVSKIVNGHGEYHMKIQQVLEHVGIGDVDSERFHGDYFVSS